MAENHGNGTNANNGGNGTRANGWDIPRKWLEKGDGKEAGWIDEPLAVVKFPAAKNVIFWPPHSQFYLDWMEQSKPGDTVYVVQFVGVETNMLCTVVRELKRAGYVVCLVLYANDCTHLIAEALFLADVVHGELARTMVSCAFVLFSNGSKYEPPFRISCEVAGLTLKQCKVADAPFSHAMMEETKAWVTRMIGQITGSPQEAGMRAMIRDMTLNPVGNVIGFSDMHERWGLNIYPIPKDLRQKLHEGKHLDIHASGGLDHSV